MIFDLSIDLFLNLSTPLTNVLLGLYVWAFFFMWKIPAIQFSIYQIIHTILICISTVSVSYR